MDKVRTINKLERYKLSPDHEEYLIKAGYINGCGSKGFKLKWLLNLISKLYNYVNEGSHLKDDIKVLCKDHDIDFTRGGYIYTYFKANQYFIEGVLTLLNWTNIRGRFVIYILLTIMMNTIGVFYFSWGKQKTYEDLFVYTNKNI